MCLMFSVKQSSLVKTIPYNTVQYCTVQYSTVIGAVIYLNKANAIRESEYISLKPYCIFTFSNGISLV